MAYMVITFWVLCCLTVLLLTALAVTFFFLHQMVMPVELALLLILLRPLFSAVHLTCFLFRSFVTAMRSRRRMRSSVLPRPTVEHSHTNQEKQSFGVERCLLMYLPCLFVNLAWCWSYKPLCSLKTQ
jgi:hypothetical protein